MERNTKYVVHCLNSSPSKKTHAFGKADRFSPCKSYGQFKYNVNEVKTKIPVTFGYGDKEQYQKVCETFSPSPNKYLIKSQFDNKSKGYSFGKSPVKVRTRQNNQKKSHHQSTNNWFNEKYNRTEQNENPETTLDKLKMKLMDVKKPVSPNPKNTKTKNPNSKEQITYQRKSITPTKKKTIPGPGTYNVFSQFGSNIYYR